eukprot:10695149-Prorocentrum_lima.AAC.1
MKCPHCGVEGNCDCCRVHRNPAPRAVGTTSSSSPGRSCSTSWSPPGGQSLGHCGQPSSPLGGWHCAFCGTQSSRQMCWRCGCRSWIGPAAPPAALASNASSSGARWSDPGEAQKLSLIHISEPTRLDVI